jgi:cytochrome c oxidase subunit IV
VTGSTMQRSLRALAVLAAAIGATFALQGLGVRIGRSFMIGDLRWTIIGIVMILAAGLVLWRSLRRR